MYEGSTFYTIDRECLCKEIIEEMRDDCLYAGFLEDEKLEFARIRISKTLYDKLFCHSHSYIDMGDKVGYITREAVYRPELEERIPLIWKRYLYNDGFVGRNVLRVYSKKDIILYWMNGGDFFENGFIILSEYIENLKDELSSIGKKYRERNFYFSGERKQMINCITYYLKVKYGNKKVWNAC